MPHRERGGWSQWSEWSLCSRTCDGGVSRQLRTCASPAGCRGEPVRYKICNMQVKVTCIQERGGWSQWSEWSLCSRTCDGGLSRQLTTCASPASCRGEPTRYKICNMQERGGWSQWSEWSLCSRTCDGGVSRQLRTCASPAGCMGEPVRCKICNMQERGGWSQWSEWSLCSRTCDGGVSRQLRTCASPAGCRGEPVRYKICNMQPCRGNVSLLEDDIWREQQCSAHDNTPYGGELFHWRAHRDDAEPCALTCRGTPHHSGQSPDAVRTVG
ncbi:hypothetical protein OBRU01_03339 [Operophtera brumata]|uniref:Uncharacterized protein n=1 Tax=Operophtera brumata TaxID=104452 RepID=A0A0L7LR06_OPEBR|nr:hypothetical protein OBRU01_03339 [Operophtera brumata]